MRVAIVHYWLVTMAGGEKVLEALCRMYPQADLFTHVVDRARLSEVITSHNIQTTFINRLPGSKKHYARYLPLMPLALGLLLLGMVWPRAYSPVAKLWLAFRCCLALSCQSCC